MLFERRQQPSDRIKQHTICHPCPHHFRMQRRFHWFGTRQWIPFPPIDTVQCIQPTEMIDEIFFRTYLWEITNHDGVIGDRYFFVVGFGQGTSFLCSSTCNDDMRVEGRGVRGWWGGEEKEVRVTLGSG